MIHAVADRQPTENDPDILEVIGHELALLAPETRSSTGAVLALLHQRFREFGASGRTWDRAEIAAALATDAGPSCSRPSAAERLAPDVILLTYVARRPDRTSLRSSLWVREDATWRLLFHQGTPCGDGGGGTHL